MSYTFATYMKKIITILGIETSCDETGVALVKCSKVGNNYKFKVVENLLHSQIKLHKKTGGVVPEVAAREHAVKLPLLLKKLSDKYGLTKLKNSVDAIAVTSGPGLITSLLTGVEVARVISYAWKKPLVAVNHLEAHIYANLLQANLRQVRSPKSEVRNFEFPLLALIVSGGHTELVTMKKHLNYKIIGSTRDDAAGECFDKTAKLLGLSYPGGPALSALAQKGNPNAIDFPRPMLDQNNLEFSFAGLKTAVAIYLQKNKVEKKKEADIAASIEQAIVDTLVGKTLSATKKYKPKMVALAGGVSANHALRRELKAELINAHPKIKVIEPSLNYTTDNAAMIAAAGGIKYFNSYTTSWDRIKVNPNLQLK